MPKIWYPTEEIISSHRMMNEDMWFKLNQKMILGLVNTDFGRDMLAIPKEYPRILKITKNMVRCYLGQQNGRDIFLNDVRIGAKYGNAIRQFWPQFRSYSKHFSVSNWAVPGVSQFAVDGAMMCGTTTTVYPDPSPGTTTNDAEMERSTSDNTWAAYHNASASTSIYDSTNIFARTGNDGAPRYYGSKSTCLFDASAINDTDSIDSGTVTLTGLYKSDGDNDAQGYIGIYTCTPASNTSTVTDDFDQVGTTIQSDAVDITGQSAVAANVFTLNATGLSNVSKTGVTKFALMEGHTAEDSPIGSASDNYMGYASADTALTTVDPKMIIISSAGASGHQKNLLTLGVG